MTKPSKKIKEQTLNKLERLVREYVRESPAFEGCDLLGGAIGAALADVRMVLVQDEMPLDVEFEGFVLSVLES